MGSRRAAPGACLLPEGCCWPRGGGHERLCFAGGTQPGGTPVRPRPRPVRLSRLWELRRDRQGVVSLDGSGSVGPLPSQAPAAPRTPPHRSLLSWHRLTLRPGGSSRDSHGLAAPPAEPGLPATTGAIPHIQCPLPRWLRLQRCPGRWLANTSAHAAVRPPIQHR